VDPVPDPLLLRKSVSNGNRTQDLLVCSQELWPLDHRSDVPSYNMYSNERYILVETWLVFLNPLKIKSAKIIKKIMQTTSQTITLKSEFTAQRA
jgi:hypothetical protein